MAAAWLKHVVEWLDVVDEQDRIIARATRADVHARRCLHRSVHVLVSNRAGAIYVQRRALTKDCSPGLWDTSAAGHVGHGESYDQAAPRELAEELGLLDEVLQPLCALPASSATGYEFVRVYHCITGHEPVPDRAEIAAGGWWSEAALRAWIARAPDDFTEVFRTIFARFAAARPDR